MITAGISVRESSVRFPSKALALVEGIPSFEYCYRSVKRIIGIDEVYVLTTAASPGIIRHCELVGIPYKVSLVEEDVIGRYLELEGDYIVRVTGDDIFMSQAYFDVLMSGIEAGHQYVYMSGSHVKGMECEIYSRNCLERIYSGLDDDQRRMSEYMSWYFRDNPVVNQSGYEYGPMGNVELDTVADYEERVKPYARYLAVMDELPSPESYARFCR